MSKHLIAFFFLLIFSSASSCNGAGSDTNVISICSWNIANMGRSKSDEEIEIMADVLKAFDVIAIQKVVAGPAGAQAIGRLGEALKKKGAQWEYAISNPTSSVTGGSERYAFMWKPARLRKKGRAWLDTTFALEIDREPYMMTFERDSVSFTLVSFHAVPKNKHPESEIRYFRTLPLIYNDLKLIFCGDFNTPQSNTVFYPLKEMCYEPVLTGQKTTLSQNCSEGDCLASEYDNFFRQEDWFKTVDAGIIPFHKKFDNTTKARVISDHLPIYFRFRGN